MSNLSFDEMLSKITSNDELMSTISQVVKNNSGGEITDTLPDVLSLIASSGNEKKTESKAEAIKDDEENQATQTIKKNVTNNEFTELIGSLGKQISNSSQLLLAIKPYLNKSRQGMIDTMIKLSSLAKVINLGR